MNFFISWKINPRQLKKKKKAPININEPTDSSKQCRSWNANCFLAIQNSLCILQQLRFITTLTMGCHWSRSSARQISFSILSSHLCTDMPSDLFPSDISMKTLYLFSLKSATHSALLMFPHWIIIKLLCGVKAMKLLIMQFSLASC